MRRPGRLIRWACGKVSVSLIMPPCTDQVCGFITFPTCVHMSWTQVERLLGEGVSIHNTVSCLHSNWALVRVTALPSLQSVDLTVFVHGQDEEGRTALHWAADAGQLGVVKLLVQRGANVQQKVRDIL